MCSEEVLSSWPSHHLSCVCFAMNLFYTLFGEVDGTQWKPHTNKYIFNCWVTYSPTVYNLLGIVIWRKPKNIRYCFYIFSGYRVSRKLFHTKTKNPVLCILYHCSNRPRKYAILILRAVPQDQMTVKEVRILSIISEKYRGLVMTGHDTSLG